MADIKACLSSKSMEWETPRDLFRELDAEFGFTLDPCCTDENAKCAYHFTKEQNGLAQNWGGQIVFCNPPYGRELRAWVEKCSNEAKKPGTRCVMLIPARTDTAYFHEFIWDKAEVRFLRGRLHFNGHKNAAPFPSMVVIFG